jgi:hypothetical protein
MKETRDVNDKSHTFELLARIKDSSQALSLVVAHMTQKERLTRE